jgi:C1A family cysteine protease
MTQHFFGWMPSLADHRDIVLSVTHTVNALPTTTNNRKNVNWCYDQGSESSCTGNAWADLCKYVWKKDLQKDVNPSRNFIYYNEREIEQDTPLDNGATLRSGAQVLSDTGFCLEETWGYSQGTLYTPPPVGCYTQAASYKIKSYIAVQDNHMARLYCLASGYPFVFGMTVTASFETQNVSETGIVPMPTQEDKVIGGHAIMAVDYDDARQVFVVLNSWGSSWGDNGFFYLPYSYMESNLTSDYWTLRVV